ncbi:MAG: sulfite exporter TauE/SafE family protein [Thermoleophilia bacterium]|nr:sulfite exporter TauE/SafE family protein [Thermoleophilia bacterium]
MTDVLEALVLGFLAGILSGMFGVGGGILFVPTLALVVGLSQLEAQATSLAAMVPVVAAGAWRHHRHGHVRWRPAAVVGLASALGVAAGAALADALADATLRRLFAGLLLVVAAQLALAELRREA